MTDSAGLVIIPPSPMRRRAAGIFSILLEASLYLLPVFFLFKRSYAFSIYVWITGFFCLCLLLEGRRPQFSSPVTVIVLLFILSVIIPSILTIGSGNTWREGKLLLYGVACFLIIVDQCRVKPYLVKRYLLLLIALGFFTSLDALWQFSHAGIDLLGIKTESTRMTALFSNPNYLGFFLSGIPPLCFWLYDYAESVWMKAMWAGSLYIVVLAIALSGTRSALLGLVLFLLLMVLFRKKGHAFLFLPFLLVIPMVFFLNGKDLLGRFMGMIHLQGDRLAIWREAWHWIFKHPWFGNGLDSYKDTVPAMLEAGHKWLYSAPHNFFLEVWFASGVVALILFCLFLGRIVTSHFPFRERLGGRQGYLFSAFWMVFLASFISIPFFSRYVSFYFWLYLGLLFGAFPVDSDGSVAEEKVVRY